MKNAIKNQNSSDKNMCNLLEANSSLPKMKRAFIKNTINYE